MSFVAEPLLQFAFDQKLVYPRDGLYLYGPVGDTQQVQVIRYGVIGTTEGVRRFRQWCASVRKFIDVPEPGPRSRAVEPQHVAFPGFAEAFHAEWPAEPSVVVSDIDAASLGTLLRLQNRHEAIKGAVSVYVEKLIAVHNRVENPPTMWFVVIPEDVYQLGRPKSVVPKSQRLVGAVKVSQLRARQLEQEPTLFGTEEEEATVYKYATHFRRQLKARLLKDRIVTQIIRETTLTPSEFLNSRGYPSRRVEDEATIAWKLCTAAYYKAGGKPWQLADVRSGVCYVGLVYKRTELTNDTRHACCAAQMFLADGDGVVFRGALGPWYQEDLRQFHVSREAAKNLMSMIVGEYRGAHDDRAPNELFVHAKSAFSDDEWSGFLDACPTATNLVGVQIADARDDLKLYRPGNYPVIRGTAVRTGTHSAFLWTSGYVPRIDTYLGPETPNPISVRVSRGTCDLDVVLRDVMALTKINFNTCLHNDRMPVTIRFADAVGDVLISAPIDSEPRLPFKFYI